MNNFIKLILVVCIAYGGYTWFNKSGDTDFTHWKSHQFALENISAMFPVEPKSEKKSFQGIKAEFVGVHQSKAEYSVSILTGKDFSDGDYYPNSLINKGASLNASRDIIINGFSGQEYNLSFNNQSVIQRFIKYNKTLVNQTIFFNDNELKDGTVDKFLDSLIL